MAIIIFLAGIAALTYYQLRVYPKLYAKQRDESIRQYVAARYPGRNVVSIRETARGRIVYDAAGPTAKTFMFNEVCLDEESAPIMVHTDTRGRVFEIPWLAVVRL